MTTKITITELNNGKSVIKLQHGTPELEETLYIDDKGCLRSSPYTLACVEQALEVVDKFKEKRLGNKVKRIVLEETIDV